MEMVTGLAIWTFFVHTSTGLRYVNTFGRTFFVQAILTRHGMKLYDETQETQIAER
jgi:hypothetical protein